MRPCYRTQPIENLLRSPRCTNQHKSHELNVTPIAHTEKALAERELWSCAWHAGRNLLNKKTCPTPDAHRHPNQNTNVYDQTLLSRSVSSARCCCLLASHMPNTTTIWLFRWLSLCHSLNNLWISGPPYWTTSRHLYRNLHWIQYTELRAELRTGKHASWLFAELLQNSARLKSGLLKTAGHGRLKYCSTQIDFLLLISCFGTVTNDACDFYCF